MLTSRRLADHIFAVRRTMARLLLILTLFQLSLPATAFVQTQPFAARRALGLSKSAKSVVHPSTSVAAAITTSPERPIVVFGAGGKTGRIIAELLAGQEQYVRAVTRSEQRRRFQNIPKASEPYVSYVEGDVTSYDSVRSIIQQGAAGVVWAATSSGVKKGGGDALEVDYKGLYFVAKACLECKVKKLALISAGCITHPHSAGSKAVNTMTQWTYGDLPWTDAKLAGETAVRELYSDKKKNKKNLSYVIIRPAASLSDKPPIPVKELLVMQGDVYSSAQTISRTNVAHIVVSAILKGKATDFVTFDVAPAVKLYKNDEGNFWDLLNLSTKKQTTNPDLPKALVHRDASTYEELLDGLVKDDDMSKDYGSIVTDYRVETAPSVKEFA